MPYEEQHRSQNGLADSQPRICGAWVEVIPEISNTRRSNAVLETAVRAFALSITQNRPDISAARLRASHAYCHAIESLRGNFDLSGGQFRADLAASIMCLGLTEVSLFCTSVVMLCESNWWLAHVSRTSFGIYTSYQRRRWIISIARTPRLPKWRSSQVIRWLSASFGA